MKTYAKKLYKSRDNKVISGVMGGLGEYFDIDPVLFRVLYIGITVSTAILPGIVAYLLMAIVMPSAHANGANENYNHNHENHTHHE